MSVSRHFARSMAVALAMAMVVAAPAAAQKPPVRVGGSVKEPTRIQYVTPVYPKIAMQARVQGMVLIEATIGTDGSVVDTKVLRPVPLLDAAALEAVKQWKYDPTLIDGEAVQVLMVVTVNFTLKGSAAASEAQTSRLRVGGTIKEPKKISNVPPEYPEDARAAGIEGTVILELAIGKDGSVIEAKILRGVPSLDQAAVAAVKQWKYEPLLINGEPVEVALVVTVKFTLK